MYLLLFSFFSNQAGYVHLSLKGSKNTQKRCVTVKRENGVIIKWIVGDCASKRPYVCEKRPKNGRGKTIHQQIFVKLFNKIFPLEMFYI